MKYVKKIFWLLLAAYVAQVGYTMYSQRAVLVQEPKGCKVYHKTNTGALGYMAYIPFAGVWFTVMPKYSQYIFEMEDTTITMEHETPDETLVPETIQVEYNEGATEVYYSETTGGGRKRLFRFEGRGLSDH